MIKMTKKIEDKKVISVVVDHPSDFLRLLPTLRSRGIILPLFPNQGGSK